MGLKQDCAELAKRGKIAKYGDHIQDLEAAGICFRPAAFSCYGRFHPDVTRMLTTAASKAVRRSGGDQKSLLRQWKKDLSTTIWARAASMVQRCVRESLSTEEEQRREKAALWSELTGGLEEESDGLRPREDLV